MNRFGPAFAACLLALALGGCDRTPAAGEAPPLAGARIGGAFTMTDQDGRTVTERSFPGRYRVMYFGYSYCPDICPLDLQRLMQGLRGFAVAAPGRAARVQPIFVTVDPERDTQGVLKTYVAAFGPGLVGLRGTPEQLAAMAKAYAVVYRKQVTPGASGYLMDHSRMAILFAPDGAPIAMLPSEESAEKVTAELERWVA